MNTSSLKPLPTDVMANVLQFIVPSQQRNVRLSCRRLNAECDGELLWCCLCSTAGIHRVIPQDGISWKSFAKRIGLTCGAAGRGEWAPLVGYQSAETAAPTSLVDEASLPWRAVATTGREQVASVAIVSVGSTHRLQCAARDLVLQATMLADRSTTPYNADIAPPSPPCSPSDRAASPRSGRSSPVPQQGFGGKLPGPAIEFFDICPLIDDDMKVTVMQLNEGPLGFMPSADGELMASHYRHVARLVETLWSSCSTIIFLYDDEHKLRQWTDNVGSVIGSASADESMFCSKKNTPNVFFATASKSNGPIQSFAGFPVELRHWLANRSNRVESSTIDDLVTELVPSPKRYNVPGWIAPLVSPALQPCHLLRMTIAAATGTPASDLWGVERMQQVISQQLNKVHQFYKGAMETEIEDRTKKGTIPMASEDIVVNHRHFFFAALRSYSMQLFAICGNDVAAGTQLLETLKRDINTTFRELWRNNSVICRQFCTKLYDQIFDPIEDQFVNRGGFDKKHSLKDWFAAIHTAIGQYRKMAQGPRQMEVLAERMAQHTIPRVLAYAAAQPIQTHLHIEDLVLATKEIKASTEKMMLHFRSVQDELMGKMQRETAIYTTVTGSEWTATLHGNCCQAMIQRRRAAEEWEFAWLERCEALQLDPYTGEGGEEILPLPLLRSAAIQAAMAEEGQQRAATAKAAVDLAPSDALFVKDVSIVQHSRRTGSGFLSSIRRSFRG